MRREGFPRPLTLGAVLVFLLVYTFPFLQSCSPEGSWDIIRHNVYILQEPEWNRRIKLTVDNSSGAEALVDFPILVTLDSSRIDYADCLAGGSDIQFRAADGETVLPHEIDTWNPLGVSSIWALLPEIPAGSTDTFFYLYYNSITPPEEAESGAVWNDSYVGVWHLNEPGGVDGTIYADSTLHGLHAEGGRGSRTCPDGVAGKIGRGQDFSGEETHRIDCPPPPLLDDLGPVSFSFWVYDLGLAPLGAERIINKNRVDIRNGEQGGNPTLVFERTYTGSNLFKAYISPWSYGGWYFITLSWSGSNQEEDIILYSDGSPILDFNRNDGGGAIETDALAHYTFGNTSWDSNDNLHGILDEIRISQVVRSAAWVDAQYRSMTDSLLTYSAPEEIAAR